MLKEKIQNNLEYFGLSKSETKIYYSILALEDAPVEKIARHADINRTTVYPILERLEKIGLVSKVRKKGKTVYRAAKPEKFLDILDEKKEKILEVLPDLKSLFILQEGRPNVQLFEGAEGIKTVLNGILEETKTEVLIFSDGEGFLKMLPGWSNIYLEKRSKKKIATRLIVKSSAYNVKTAKQLRDGLLKESKTTAIRLLPESYNISNSGFDIYNNKTVFYSFDKQNIAIAVIIESKIISQLMRTVYEILWNEAGRYEGALLR